MACGECACESFQPINKNPLMCNCGHPIDSHTEDALFGGEAVMSQSVTNLPSEIQSPTTLDSPDTEETIEELEANHKTYSSKPIQKIVYKHIIRQKSGLIIGITGRPNFGKSWTGNKVIKDWNWKLYIDEYLTYEVDDIFEKTFSNIKINGKPLSKEEFDKIPTDHIKQWCKDNIDTVTVKNGKALLVDEAGASIYNRDFFSAENKAMAKLVQVWRFMRMLVIFVIPEKVEFLEKTLREFFDVKIVMVDKNEAEEYAAAIVYERKGRNYKDEPIFARIPGCRYGGFIKIRPFSKRWPKEAEEYEKRSRIFKTSIIMQAWREVMESDGKTFVKGRKKENGIDDVIEEAKKVKKELMLPNKKTNVLIYNTDLIQNKLGVSKGIASRIRVALEMEGSK